MITKKALIEKTIFLLEKIYEVFDYLKTPGKGDSIIGKYLTGDKRRSDLLELNLSEPLIDNDTFRLFYREGAGLKRLQNLSIDSLIHLLKYLIIKNPPNSSSLLGAVVGLLKDRGFPMDLYEWKNIVREFGEMEYPSYKTSPHFEAVLRELVGRNPGRWVTKIL